MAIWIEKTKEIAFEDAILGIDPKSLEAKKNTAVEAWRDVFRIYYRGKTILINEMDLQQILIDYLKENYNEV